MAHENSGPGVPAHRLREEEPVRPQVRDIAHLIHNYTFYILCSCGSLCCVTVVSKLPQQQKILLSEEIIFIPCLMVGSYNTFLH